MVYQEDGFVRKQGAGASHPIAGRNRCSSGRVANEIYTALAVLKRGVTVSGAYPARRTPSPLERPVAKHGAAAVDLIAAAKSTRPDGDGKIAKLYTVYRCDVANTETVQTLVVLWIQNCLIVTPILLAGTKVEKIRGIDSKGCRVYAWCAEPQF